MLSDLRVFVAVCATCALLCLGVGHILAVLEKLGKRLEKIQELLEERKGKERGDT